ncbi:5-oxoprolinase subunit PxpA [Rathayibacter festucae]|uniref:5-oxoprolinase subunit A n=1 Tax=Rathayibacter festucae TaxID=110937 RepID=A0ABX6H1S2_9MICO|nr:5-oxoprolinase subunit PxpA [Rathayibacter festucae]QHC63754.1 5-oxoprolinase subunit PxpA [Rathayibacter festucae]
MRRTIDLNADLGEGFGVWSLGDDDAMLRLVTSANIACGFHAGDPSIMLATCRTAAERGVAIGAHVAYRDLAGFGRRDLPVDPAELHADVVYQLGALQAVARAAGTEVRYVKPHGALYNRIVHDERQAEAVVAAVRDTAPALPLLGLGSSAVERAAAGAGLPFLREAFVDRGYRADGTLVPRGEPGDLLTDPAAVAARAVRMVLEGTVTAASGEELALDVDSLCVHGDTPGAVAMAEAVRAALSEAGVALVSAAP